MMFVLASVLAIAALAGCGSKKEATPSAASPAASAAATATPEPSAEPTPDPRNDAFTLTVSYWVESANGYYEAVVNKFKETYPNAAVELNLLPGDKYADMLNTKLAAGDGYDVMFTQQTQVYAKAGYIADLSDQPWVDRMIDTNKTLNSYNGKIYGASIGASSFGAFYNKKIFNDLGLSVPTTWDEFLAICEAIKAAGIAPIVEGFKDAWTIQGVYLPIASTAYFAANPNFERDVFDGKARVNGPEVQDAVARFGELAAKGYFNKNILSIGYDQSVQEFIDGKGAIHLMGSWTPGVIDSKVQGFDLGFFPIPDRQGKVVMIATPDNAVTVNANSERLEASKLLAGLFVDKEMLELFCKNAQLSAFKDIEAEYSNAAMADLQQAIGSHPTALNPGLYFTASAQDSINTALTKLVAGGKVSNELEEAEKNYERDKATVGYNNE